jgi:MoaA/NifB/PqqE/SkfB family radical SAM enzyme
MQEWASKNFYNSFNSIKGLTFFESYKAINNWRLGKIKIPPPPIEVSFDPIHACNLACEHCNSHRYLVTGDVQKDNRMPDEHMLNLTNFLAEWGVSAICYGGGGEPTLHTKLGDTLELSHFLGVENSIATNGTLLTTKLTEIMSRTCRWVGISVDAATSDTYKIGRKQNYFTQTIINISKLADYVKKQKSNCDVAFKFLIFDYNQHEIYKACQLAKALGVKTFHVRPADFRHQGLGEQKKKNKFYNIKLIEKQFKKCHELEDDNFKVFSVVHKFNADFTPRRQFSQCFTSPICIQLCGNGNVYLCPDTRYIDYYKLGTHYPDPKNILTFWGSEKHYDLVFKDGCSSCVSRCTFNPYNEQFENLFIKDNDPFCRNFV